MKQVLLIVVESYFLQNKIIRNDLGSKTWHMPGFMLLQFQHHLSDHCAPRWCSMAFSEQSNKNGFLLSTSSTKEMVIDIQRSGSTLQPVEWCIPRCAPGQQTGPFPEHRHYLPEGTEPDLKFKRLRTFCRLQRELHVLSVSGGQRTGLCCSLLEQQQQLWPEHTHRLNKLVKKLDCDWSLDSCRGSGFISLTNMATMFEIQ